MDNFRPKKRLVFGIIKFLQDELNTSDLTEDKKESVEVAIQCLETAYDTTNEKDGMEESAIPNLLSLIPSSSAKTVTDQQKLDAETYKNEGNTAIKNDKLPDALFYYTKAIDINPNNAVYYCNRAAVYSKMEKHLEAIKDCKEAIKLDPTYGKAYSRLGIAYSNLNMFEEARTAYKTALKYDPTNAMYENNLKLAEERLSQNQTEGSLSAQSPMEIFGNPTLVGMATQMLNDPSIRNMMSGLVPINEVENPNYEMLMQVGQTIATRMAEVNPNFIDNLRRSMNQQSPHDNPNTSSDPKDRQG